MNQLIEGSPLTLETLASLANAGEWTDALNVARVLLEGGDNSADLIQGAAKALIGSNYVDAAERLLSYGIRQWPDNIWLEHGLADLATSFRDCETAAARWQEMRIHHPSSPLGLCGLADLYRRKGREVEASQLFAEAAQQFPNYVWGAAGHAWSASRSNDWSTATQRWQAVTKQFPWFVHGHRELIQALLACGRGREAVEAARRGQYELPDEASLREAEYWISATQRGSGGVVGEHAVPDVSFRAPLDLAISATPLKRVMVIGSCLVGAWADVFRSCSPSAHFEHMLFNRGVTLPPTPPSPVGEYDFQVVQIPLRSVVPEYDTMRLQYSSPDSFQRAFEDACDNMTRLLADAMRWNRDHGILTFVVNFLPPQQNPMGRLLPRDDLRNFVYFVERLNAFLAETLKAYSNAYIFDFNELVANFGRRHFQDDQLWLLAHGAGISDRDWEYDQGRLEPLERATSYYPAHVYRFVLQCWTELQAMYRTIRQIDMVKLVLIDLDDTLWRGVQAEGGNEGVSNSQEGWPLGLVEALLFLKQRGVMLGVVSKNHEDKALAHWKRIWGPLLLPEDFVALKINWRPKADNIEEILTEVNLLPHSVLFIDDNPVERAAVKSAFPQMRVLGGSPYLWRRILLWSPELQSAAITSESASRTAMVQAQVAREGQRKRMSRQDFLASLNLTVSVGEVTGTDHPNFRRAIELINKTNQFNTNGKRWTEQEFVALFANGGRVHTLDVVDKFTSYGIVGALVVSDDVILQFVMSCRVIGMDVELAAISCVLASMHHRGATSASATVVETASNLLCRDVWTRAAFTADGAGSFQLRPLDVPPLPPHIQRRDSPALG